MPTVHVTVPGLLRHAIGGGASVQIDAATLAELLDRVRRTYPLLVPLVWDEAGHVRRHVLIFHNDTATKWLDVPLESVPMHDGDTVAVVQAISGG